ncbi:MAG: glycosyltransferase, partial [Bacteroidota bacterium]
MISICIPVYNFEVEPLINELHRQGLKSNKAFEIIVLDDDSKDFFKQKNRAVKSLENVRY